MPRRPSVPIKLTIPERRELQKIREYHPKRRYWLRADIVLRADAGESNLSIAQRLEISRNTVKQWRSRFAQEGVDGLKDRPIPGRPKKSASLLPSQTPPTEVLNHGS